ncbi:MAG: hypothetical protein V2A73_04370 [Pseudomonadota bacterium]
MTARFRSLATTVVAFLLVGTTFARESRGDTTRPEPLTISIGAGWTLYEYTAEDKSDGYQPVSILEPNTASIRILAMPKLWIEPRLAVQHSVSSDDDKMTMLMLKGVVRYQFASRGPVELAGLVVPSIVHAGATYDNPSSTDRSMTELGLGWGIGLDWFLRSNLFLSIDATNPFFSYTNWSYEGADDSSSYSLGLVFNPTIAVLLNLYL